MLTCLVVTLRVRSTFFGSIDVLELWLHRLSGTNIEVK